MKIEFSENDETKGALRAFLSSLYAGAVVSYLSSPGRGMDMGASEIVYLSLALIIIVGFWHFSGWLYSNRTIQFSLRNQSDDESKVDDDGCEELSPYAFLAKQEESSE